MSSARRPRGKRQNAERRRSGKDGAFFMPAGAIKKSPGGALDDQGAAGAVASAERRLLRDSASLSAMADSSKRMQSTPASFRSG